MAKTKNLGILGADNIISSLSQITNSNSGITKPKRGTQYYDNGSVYTKTLLGKKKKKKDEEDVRTIKTEDNKAQNTQVNNTPNKEGYIKTNQKYGYYDYHDYKNKKDFDIYKKDGKAYYYDPRNKTYNDMDTPYYADPTQDKKELKEAKKYGYKERKTYKTTKNGKRVEVLPNTVAERVELETSGLTKKEKKKYAKSLIKQKDKEVKKSSYVREGSTLGELKYMAKSLKENTEPLGRIDEAYDYGKLQQEMSLAYSDMLKGKKVDISKIQKKIDNYNKFNKDVAEANTMLDTYVKSVPGQLRGMKKGVENAGALGTIGAIGGGTIGAVATKTPQGAVAGAETGAKWLGGAGYVKGQAQNTYELESGATYQTLLEMGVPDKIARKEAKRVGTENALIESGESILDLLTFGKAGAATNALKEGLIKKYGAEALKKWGVSYATNIVSEGLEEGTQEQRSIAAEKRAAEKAGIERDDSQDVQRILESAKAGGFGAAITGAGTRIAGMGGSSVYNMTKQKASQMLEIQQQVNNGTMTHEEANQKIEQVNNGTYDKNKVLDEIATQKRDEVEQAAQQGVISPAQATQEIQALNNTLVEEREQISRDSKIEAMQTRLQEMDVNGYLSKNYTDEQLQGFMEQVYDDNLSAEELQDNLYNVILKDSAKKQATNILETSAKDTNMTRDEFIKRHYTKNMDQEFDVTKEDVGKIYDKYNKEETKETTKDNYEELKKKAEKEIVKTTSQKSGKEGRLYQGNFYSDDNFNLLDDDDIKLTTKLMKKQENQQKLTKKEEQQAEYLKRKREGLKNPELNPNIKSFEDIKSDYKYTSEYKFTKADEEKIKNALDIVSANRQKRRTKQQWLDVANMIGSQSTKLDSESLKNLAFGSWTELAPNQKDNLNRQGTKYVPFSVDEWVKKVYEGAGVGTKIKEENITNTQLKQEKAQTNETTNNQQESTQESTFNNETKSQTQETKNERNIKKLNKTQQKTLNKTNNDEKLTEKEFYGLYSAHKIYNTENAQNIINAIKEEGFKGDGGFGVNLVPSNIIYKENGEPMFLSDRQYAPRKGEYVLLVPESEVDESGGGYRVRQGYKPRDFEVVKVERDFQPYYELYEKSYDQYIKSKNNNVETNQNENIYENNNINDFDMWYEDNLDMLVDKFEGKYKKAPVNPNTGSNNSEWVPFLENEYNKELEKSRQKTEITNNQQESAQENINNDVIDTKESKIRDDNGNLLKVYHRSHTKNIKQLEPKNGAIFFTDDPNASYYGNEKYSANLNIKNPLIIDGEGANFNQIKFDLPNVKQYNSTTIENAINNINKLTKKDVIEIAKAIDKNNSLEDFIDVFNTPKDALDSVVEAYTDGGTLEDFVKQYGGLNSYIDNKNIQTNKVTTTRDIVDYAKNNGYDGVVFKNVQDKTKGVVNVYAAFNSDQIINYKYDNDDIQNIEPKQNENIPATKSDNVISEKIEKPKKEEQQVPNKITEKDLKQTSKNIAKELNEAFKLNKNEAYSKTPQTAVKEMSAYQNPPTISDFDRETVVHTILSDEEAKINAEKTYNENGTLEENAAYIRGLLQSDKRLTKNDKALAVYTMKEAYNQGKKEIGDGIIQDLTVLDIEAGQWVQASKLIKQMSPVGQLETFVKMVKHSIDKGNPRFKNVKITDEMINEVIEKSYNDDNTWNQDKFATNMEKFKADIQDQLTPTLMDKFNTIRMIGMLGAPKTHIRNMLANVGNLGLRVSKNFNARLLETAFVRDQNKRTRTFKPTTKEIKNFAERIMQEEKETIAGNKYDESRMDLERNMKAFNENHKGLARVMNPISKLTNLYSGGNTYLLNAEDTLFSAPTYKRSLQEFLTARGMKTEEQVLNNPKILRQAKDFALQQALESVYRQNSELANSISSFVRKMERSDKKRHKLAGVLVEGELPFKRTPINIGKTGWEYSPVGLTSGIYDTFKSIKSDKVEISQAIDEISKGITGLGLLGVGVLLAHNGWELTAGEDDKEKKAAFDKSLGEKEYSIKIGNRYYDVSWMAPSAMPFYTGIELYQQLVKTQKFDGNAIVGTVAKTIDPLSSMSFMQGVTRTLQSYAKNTGEAISTFVLADLENYVSQYIPTLLSQIANIKDSKRRTTTVSGDSSFKELDKTWNNIKYKVPGLRETLPEATDAWGRTAKNDEFGLRFFNSLINPANNSKDIKDSTDKEIERLYYALGEDDRLATGSIPKQEFDKYLTYDKKQYNLSSEDWTKFKKTYGKIAKKGADKLVKTEKYKKASDEEKAKYLISLYDYANQKAKQEYGKKEGLNYESYKLDQIYALADAFNMPIETVITNKSIQQLRAKNGVSGNKRKYAAVDNIDGLTEIQKDVLKRKFTMFMGHPSYKKTKSGKNVSYEIVDALYNSNTTFDDDKYIKKFLDLN